MFKTIDIFKLRYVLYKKNILDNLIFSRYTPVWVLKVLANYELKKLSKSLKKRLDNQTKN